MTLASRPLHTGLERTEPQAATFCSLSHCLSLLCLSLLCLSLLCLSLLCRSLLCRSLLPPQPGKQPIAQCQTRVALSSGLH
jgi:hypothetical protein